MKTTERITIKVKSVLKDGDPEGNNIMKATVNRKELIKALITVKPLTTRIKYLPALKNVRLTTAGDHLAAVTTNLDMSIEYLVDVTDTASGACLVNCADLLNIVRSFKTPTVDITSDDTSEQLTIQALGTVINLKADMVEGYPQVIFSKGGIQTTGTMCQESMAIAATATKFIARELSHSALTGVYLRDGKITATNGHQLCTYDVSDTDIMAIVPLAPLTTAAKLKRDWTVEVYGDLITLHCNGIGISSKLINGPYPAYERVLPLDNKYTATIDRLSTLASLESLLVSTNPITLMVKIHFGPTIWAKSSNADTGASAGLDLSGSYQGPPFTAAYNIKLLANILKNIDTEKVILKVQDKTTALMAYPTTDGTEPAASKFLLMPLRLPE